MKKHFTALTIALTMLFALPFSTTVHAEETISDNSVIEANGFIPLEESEITRECALESLGLTEEEAEGMEFYVDMVDIASPRANITVNSGESKDIDIITVNSNSSKFGNIVTINGTRILASVVAVYGNGSTDASCKAYLDVYSQQGNIFTFTLNPSNSKQTQGFKDISSGTRVQFRYVCPTGVNVTFGSIIGVLG